MSGGAVIAHARVRPLPSADQLALGASLAVVAVLAAVTWGTWGDLGRDTGYDFVAGARVAGGQLPYVDFVYYYGPLAPFVLGFAALVGGASVGTFVAVGLSLAICIVGATYVLARTQTGALGAGLAATATGAIAFSSTNLSYVVPHAYSATLAVLLSLGFLIGLDRAAHGDRRSLVLAGLAGGLIALTRPEFAAGALLAACAWLVVARRAGRAGRRELVALAAPMLGIPAVVYGSFLVAISPRRLVLDNLYPIDTLRAGGSAILRSQAPLTARSIGVVLGYLLLYAAGAALLVAVARVLGKLPRVVAVVAVGVGSGVIVAVAAYDPEAARSYLQWVFGGIPAAAVLAAVALFVGGVRARRPLPVGDWTLLATLVLLAVVAAKSYDGFFFLAERAQPAVYAAPFVFVALARLHLRELARGFAGFAAGAAWLAVLAGICLGLTIKDARAQPDAVSGPGGTLYVTSAEAPLYRAALGAIESGSRPGDPVLIAPQLTALYTLSGRRDPLPEISLVPGALAGAGAEERAIASLRAAHVRLVITDRHPFTEYGQAGFGRSFDRGLASWIRRNFDHVATLRPGAGVSHTLDVWVRRAP